DQFYITTDEGSPRWRVVRADPKKPDQASWKEIVPEQPTATIDSGSGVSILGGRLAIAYLENAQSKLSIFVLECKKVRDVALPGVGTLGGPIGLIDEDEAYFSFESFIKPSQVLSMSMKTRT